MNNYELSYIYALNNKRVYTNILSDILYPARRQLMNTFITPRGQGIVDYVCIIELERIYLSLQLTISYHVRVQVYSHAYNYYVTVPFLSMLFNTFISYCYYTY